MIKNVISVHRLQCSLLNKDYALNMVSNFTLIKSSGVEICIQVPAKLTINNKVVDKNRVREYQLVFKTCEQLDLNGHWAYAIGLADGSRLVIGSKERPYPVAVSSQVLPENMSDSQLVEVTVTWSIPYNSLVFR